MRIYRYVNYAAVLIAVSIFANIGYGKSPYTKELVDITAGTSFDKDVPAEPAPKLNAVPVSNKTSKPEEDSSDFVAVADTEKQSAGGRTSLKSANLDLGKGTLSTQSKKSSEVGPEAPKQLKNVPSGSTREKKSGRQMENCFTDCLARYISPEFIVDCIGYCGSTPPQYLNCALCLGLASYVVINCGISCSLLE